MAEEKEVDYDKKMKDMQIQMLDKLGGGGLNQNDLMAFMTMAQKQEPNTFGEMMPMIMAMKMLNPPKQDSMSPMFIMWMMDSMKKSKDPEIDKKIARLEAIIREKEDKKMYENVLKEIKDVQKGKEQVGFKDILSILSDKDKIINEIKGVASDKDRELLMKEFQGQIKVLTEEVRKVQSGGSGSSDITRLKDTIAAIKDVSGELGLDRRGQKSKEEVLSGLVENISKTLAPTINKYMETMSQQPMQIAPEQAVRLQQIKAQRQNAHPEQQPSQEVLQKQPQGEVTEEQPYRDDAGNTIYPDLIQISDSGNVRKRK